MTQAVKILVATHKDYPMPSDPIYLPVFVGAKGKKTVNPAFTRDDSGKGKNISAKNPAFCELTALYWAWHNLPDADYIGLIHYRRLFRGAKRKTPISGPEVEQLLQQAQVILPQKRNYYIENLYDHYVHTMHPEPLDLAGEIIKRKYPEFYPEFEQLHARKTAHMFNMMIMPRDILDDYCKWLFDVLFTLEREVKQQGLEYDAFHARFYGRVSELLLDIYINTRHISYVEAPIYSPERTNWLKKGTHFLRAKFTGKKYGQSF